MCSRSIVGTMPSFPIQSRVFATALIAALLATPALAASFIPLDVPLYPNALSADGSTLVGANTSISRGFMWRADTGIVYADSLEPRDPVALLWDVTQDGALAVGTTATTCCGRLAGTWTVDGGWATLPMSTTTLHFRDNGHAISDDGRIVVGWHQPAAGPDTPLVWRDGVLATPAGLPLGAHPTAVSADGSVIAGRRYGLPNSESAFVWSEASGYVTLTPIGVCCNDAGAITPDGSVVVGSYTVTENATRGFRWSATGGLVALDMPAGIAKTWANDISGDGRVIVGSALPTGGQIGAALWDEDHGMRLLQEILEGELHLDLAGWRLTSASAISRDGRVVAGTAINAQGRDATWIADITPVPVPPAAWLLASAFGATGWMRRRHARPG